MTTLQLVTLATAIVGAVCGVLGAALGIVNTWHQVSKNRVRLRVVPKLGWMVGGGNVITGDRPTDLIKKLVRSDKPARWCIEVVNLSAFPVTISDLGFGRVDKPRSPLVRPELDAGKTWPARLESREAVTAYAPIGERFEHIVLCGGVAYAQTDCGTVTYGSSPILEEYVRQLQMQSGTR